MNQSEVRQFNKNIKINIKLMFRRSLFPLLGTLLIYKALTVILFVPAVKLFWAMILRLSPVHYITNSTLFSVLKIPFVPAAILIIAVLAAFWAMFEYSLIINGLDCAFRAEKIRMKALYKAALMDIGHALKPRNIPILIYAAVLIPFTELFISSNYVSQLVVPEYIMEVIRKNGLYNAVYIAVFVLCMLIVMMSAFIFHIFIIDGASFAQSLKKSISYMRRNTVRTVLFIIKRNVVLLIQYGVIAASVGIIVIGALVLLGVNHGNAARSLGNAISLVEVPILAYVTGCIMTTVQFSVISALFYEKRGEVPAKAPEDKKHFRIGSGAVAFSTVAGSAVCTLLAGYALYYAPGSAELLGNDTATVSYHRGYNRMAPENTLPAFQAAIDDGGDIAELDVQLTKDGVVVVSHDPTLRRTAGINKSIYELTYDELQQIDVGSYFSEQYTGTHVPTLDEVIKLCKGRIRLNIEIKHNEHSPELEAKTVEIIKENDFVDQCTVTSLSYEALDKVKKEEPKIKTGYILAVGVGNYYDLPSADFFSVETSFVTRGMVSEIHLRGKTVSAWTIDRYADAERMIELGVDDLITNDPEMVREALDTDTGLGDQISDFANLLNNALNSDNPADFNKAADEGLELIQEAA